MLDVQLLRKDVDNITQRLRTRGFEFDVDRYQSLETERKSLQVATQELRNERNTKSKAIGQAKAQGGDVDALVQQVNELGVVLKSKEQQLNTVQAKLQDLIAGVPNLPHYSVPIGNDEAENEEIRRWGDKPSFDFEIKDHVDLGDGLGGLDFDAAAKVTGARFVVMNGQLARLHRALTQFMLDLHTTEHGYQETYVPYLVNPDSLFGTGQLPKFADDQFVTKEEGWFLIPTAEPS